MRVKKGKKSSKDRVLKGLKSIQQMKAEWKKALAEAPTVLYNLTPELVRKLQEQEEADAALMKVSVAEDNALWAESFAELDAVNREMGQKSAQREEGYSADEVRKSLSSLRSEKRKLIEAWKEWGTANGYGPKPDKDVEEGYVHYLSMADRESWFLNQARNKGVEEGHWVSPVQIFIDQVLANSSHDSYDDSDVVPTEVYNLQELLYDRPEIVKILSSLPHPQLAIGLDDEPDGLRPRYDRIEGDLALRLARAPMCVERPGIMILSASSTWCSMKFDDTLKVIERKEGTSEWEVKGGRILREGYGGDVREVPMNLVRANVEDILRRYAFRVRLITNEIENVSSVWSDTFIRPDGSIQYLLAKWGAVTPPTQTIKYMGTFRSTLRYPDTQRVIPVRGSRWVKKGKDLKGLKSLKGLPCRSYCCSRCTTLCATEPGYVEYLGSLNRAVVGTPTVKNEDGSRKTLAYTPHMKDEYDLRAYQAKVRHNTSWEEVYDQKLWKTSTAWAATGTTGSWRCLVCGGSALDESLELDVVTRLGRPRWSRDEKTQELVFTPATVWKFRVKVFGPRFLKKLKQRPEVKESLKRKPPKL